MGAVAHLRQAMLDAEYQHDAPGPATPRSGRPRPPFDPALEAPARRASRRRSPSGGRRTPATRSTARSTCAEEFGTTCVIVGGREAAKVVDRLKAQDVPVVLRLDFPEEPKVPTEAEYRKRELGRSRRAAEGAREHAPRSGRSGSPRRRTWKRPASGSRFSSDGLAQVAERSTPRSAR